MNIGQFLGPVVGGVLLEYWGFKMPFLVFGALQTSMGIWSYLLLPDYRGESKYVYLFQSICRTSTTIGKFLGPVAGGILITLGGFKMPFIVFGSIQISMTVVGLFLLPAYGNGEYANQRSCQHKKKERKC